MQLYMAASKMIQFRTARKRIQLEKLTVPQFVKKLGNIHETL